MTRAEDVESRTDVENGVASVEREGVLELVSSVGGVRVLRGKEFSFWKRGERPGGEREREKKTHSRVSHPSVGLHQHGGSEVLV